MCFSDVNMIDFFRYQRRNCSVILNVLERTNKSFLNNPVTPKKWFYDCSRARVFGYVQRLSKAPSVSSS